MFRASRTHCLLVLFLAAACCGGPIAAGADKFPGQMSPEQLRALGFEPLIQNDSLAAWNVSPWHVNHWTIRDGLISYDGKASGKGKSQDNSLWTKKSYGDLVMYAEWRMPEKPAMKPTPIVLYNGNFLMGDDGKRVTRPHLDAGDSGLMFRGTQNCQANIWSQELGSGEINGYRTNQKLSQTIRRACIPIKNADRPLGEWNAFLITLKGSRMTTELNGERVIDTPDLPDLPKSGPIGLQHHGKRVSLQPLAREHVQYQVVEFHLPLRRPASKCRASGAQVKGNRG